MFKFTNDPRTKQDGDFKEVKTLEDQEKIEILKRLYSLPLYVLESLEAESKSYEV